MATVTPGATLPVSAPYNTNPSYSGTFIPTIWSGKLNEKFYATSVFADICNRNWEGDVSDVGDKVIINNIPTVSISDYAPGGGLNYQTLTPDTIELTVDRAKAFGFNVNDVLEYQSKPSLMEMFSNDAAQQMRIAIDSTCIYNTFNQGSAANRGATAGVRSGSVNLGTDSAPLQFTGNPNTVLNTIIAMAGVLDEQNVPDDGRWVVIDPMTRTLLLQSNLAQAQVSGDSQSIMRNGKIGTIDRFTIYVSNQLPTIAANGTVWVSGDGSEQTISAASNANKRRAIIAGHKSAISFASQMVKTEQLANPTDFGKLVRGLQVFGYKVTKPEALALAVVY